MTTEQLYTTETPDSGLGDNADLAGGGHGGSTGSTFVFGAGGNVTGVRFYAPATVIGTETFTAELYSPTSTDTGGTGTGTLLKSKAVAGTSITAAAWNVITFDTPQAVSAGAPYRHVVHNTAGRYVAKLAYFSTDHTNGNVTGYQSGHDYGGSAGVLRNNVFMDQVDAGTYPNKNFNQPSYLIDTQFEATAVTLTVADASQAQSTDAVALTQVHHLTVADAAQAQTTDSIALTQVHVLAVNDAAQSMTSDTVVLGATGLPPPASRIEVISVADRTETIAVAASRTERVIL